MGKKKVEFDQLMQHLLNLTRLLMLLFIGACVALPGSGITGWRQGLDIVLTALFVMSHFLCNRFGRRYVMWFNALDFLLATVFGLVYMNQNLYLLLFGIVGVSFFLETDDKRMMRGFLWLLGSDWAVQLAWEYAWKGSIDGYETFFGLGFLAFSCLVGTMIRYYMSARGKIASLYEELNQSHVELTGAHEQLHSYAQQVEELTVMRERNHIAREIHDTVGHTMTALLVQLQAARKLQDRDLDKSRETLVRCEELARAALQEVRLSVRNLREEEGQALSLVESLRRLLAEFSEMTGVLTIMHLEGDPSYVSASLQPTIYRVVQESLTNAKRHGNAQHVALTLRSTAEQVWFEIADDGAGMSAEAVPGFGLINMRERVMEQGGRVHVTSEKGKGFAVQVEFPLQQQSWRYGGQRA